MKYLRPMLLGLLMGSAFGQTNAIKVDQVGYLPDASKIAIVANASAQTFSIRSTANDAVVFQGQLTSPALDSDSGDQVQRADFSKLTQTGQFYVDVPGVGKSYRFSVAPDVYNRAYYMAMRFFYGQRCGTAVNMAPDFPQYKHEICHTNGGYDASAGKDGPHVSTHGWHDAGDYGRYSVNSGISTATLLWAWELYGDRIKSVNLHIPESGNGTPDILNEVRWNLDWMLTMQDDDGGVWHKQTSTHFCAFIMPENDKLPSEVVGTGSAPFKGSCATADFAAVMAIAARDFKPFDAAYSKKVLDAARRAWAWNVKNPDVTFHNPHGVTTGAYDDNHCDDESLWAAAELARTTGEAEFNNYFLQHYSAYLDSITATKTPSWNMVAPLALWTYVLGNGKDTQAQTAIRQRTIDAANAIVGRVGANGYLHALTTKDYIWGSNGVLANYSLELLLADRFKPDPRYRAAALDNLHYILGRNTLSLSFVTQLGDNAYQHPHHRPSEADGVPGPWPGMMSGGPNVGRQDSYMKKNVAAGIPPAKSYVDATPAYACNEVAINWQAPLVFLLASLNVR